MSPPPTTKKKSTGVFIDCQKSPMNKISFAFPFFHTVHTCSEPAETDFASVMLLKRKHICEIHHSVL